MSRLTWLGHSTVVVEIDGTRLLTDPVLRRRVAHLRRRSAVAAVDAGTLDAILISHLHYDHLDLRSLAQLDRAVAIVVPRGAAALARRVGFTTVIEVVAGVEVAIGALRVTATQAMHDGARRPFGVAGPALGYVVAGSSTVYFAGDTDLFAEMESLGPLDAALLPIWGWGPKVGAGHLDPQRAAEALRLLRPTLAVPIHWGTYGAAFAAAPTDAPARAFVRAAAERAPSVDVHVLSIGESCVLAQTGSPPSDDGAGPRNGFPRSQ